MKLNLKQDNFVLGLILGAVTPVIPFCIIYFTLQWLFPAYLQVRGESTIELLVIILNVVIMRQYMVKYKFEKTGRGLLMVTFVYILIYAFLEFVIK